MTSDRKIGITVWFLGLSLALVSLFSFTAEFTATVWCTFSFICIAFIIELIFNLVLISKSKSPDEKLLGNGGIFFSYVYMIIQTPIAIAVAKYSVFISFKLAFFINFLLLVTFLTASLSSLIGNKHITEVEKRQKNNHIEL